MKCVYSYVCNEPAKRKWLGRSGTFMASGLGVGLWYRRPGFDPRTVRYMCNFKMYIGYTDKSPKTTRLPGQ